MRCEGARSGKTTLHLEEVKMKNHIVPALLLAGVMTLPAFAQSTMQPATQSAPADQAAPKADNATGKTPLQPDTHEGFWGKMNPFARKKYVQRQTAPIRDRINELDELTASNSKMIKDVDSRAQQGIQLASAKANEADQHAVDAGNKATAAQQTAQSGSHPPEHGRAGGHEYRSVPGLDPDRNPFQVRADPPEPECKDGAR
jgi:hypothetical protein